MIVDFGGPPLLAGNVVVGRTQERRALPQPRGEFVFRRVSMMAALVTLSPDRLSLPSEMSVNMGRR